MLELLASLFFDFAVQLLIWLAIEVFGFVFTSSRALIYVLSVVLIAVFIWYFGAEKPLIWARGGALFLMLLAADMIILPWLERRYAPVAARREASRKPRLP